MGYIEKPTYALTDINEKTGLSVEAITALELLKSDTENIHRIRNSGFCFKKYTQKTNPSKKRYWVY